MASRSKKLFWAYVAIEVIVAGGFGVLVAMAQEKPWARQPKPKLEGKR